MIGREVAHGIGCASVTGEREGLAAAAAEIQFATRAAQHLPSLLESDIELVSGSALI
jgi:hypothetical protein